MEFTFNINHLFGETISVVDNRLQPFKNHGSDDLQANLQRVIDEMGTASAKAQSLNGPITSAYKLRYSDHKLYVVKDGSANRGAGCVVGILKMGRKKLFVLDKHGNQNEMEPLCVLDFYVHESCQRKGYGRRLFDHMMKVEHVKAQHLAIDRPSNKFTSFLMKHYNLRATLPQVNNYVIFEGFFSNQPEQSYVRNRRLGSGKPPIAPHSRQGPSKPQGGYRNASSGLWSPGSHSPLNQRRISNPEEIEALKNVKISPVNMSRSASAGSLSSTGSLDGIFTESMDVTSGQGQAAQATHYSRYLMQGTSPTTRSRSGSRTRESITRESPLAQSPARNTSPNVGNVRLGLRSRENTPPFGAVGSLMMNSHQDMQGSGGHLKVTPKATPMANNYESPPTVQPSNSNKTTISAYESPSTTSTINNNKTTMSTYGSPANYSAINAPESEAVTTPEGNYNLCSQWQPRTMNSSWNVLGVPPSGKQSNSPSNRSQMPRTTTRFY